jgi:hypothetical protein
VGAMNLALLAPLALGACLIAPPALCDGAYDFDHTQVLGPEINLDMVVTDSPFLTRDRKDLYFARNSLGDNAFFVWWSHRDDPTGAWSVPVKMGFAQQANASNPYVTADGKTLYYTENTVLMVVPRNPATGQFDGTPRRVDRPMNVREMGMTDDQLDMYYESVDGSGPPLTYHAHRSSVDTEFPVTGQPVTGLSIPTSTAPAISSDGAVLMVATMDHFLYRGVGGGDVFTLDPSPIEPMPTRTYDGSLTDDTIMVYAREGTGIVTVERKCTN